MAPGGPLLTASPTAADWEALRAAAVEAAVTAAESILAVSAKGKVAADLIAKGIQDVRAKLN